MGEADRARDALIVGRAARQGRSIEAALTGRGLSDAISALTVRAVALATNGRSTLNDERHPAYLHPGRSVLVLLHDVEELPPDALPLAALHESEDAALRVGRLDVEAEFDEQVVRALAHLPLPGSGDLEEKLVLLDRPSALAVLAERLDHLRHLHLRTDKTGTWRETHGEVRRAWQPFAHRIDGRLAVRFDHWTRVFEKRLGQLPRV